MVSPSGLWIVAAAVGLLGDAALASGPPPQPSAAELARAIDRLSVTGSVLYVAAHPDDENTRLLAWLANHARVRTGYLSLTRGEGGQNLIGAEQAPLLGVIRTQELLAARGVDGAEQLFTRARDFGYSKTPEETLAIWGKDELLADVVWAIRRFRPDVIVTRFSPEQRDTHGHHVASAMLALEAFERAADPAYRPEQLKWVTPWQARRIVWNKGVWAGSTEDLTGFLKMDVGGYDPAIGASYGELAARSRSMHKSQGFGAAPGRGATPEYFKLLAGEPMRRSILDGVDLGGGRWKGAEPVLKLFKRARAELKLDRPDAALPALVEAAGALRALPADPWRAHVAAALDRIIAGCAGLFADAFAAEAVAVPGGPVKVVVEVVNRSPAAVTLEKVALGGEVIAVGRALEPNQPWQLERRLTLPVETPLSNPYWLVDPPEAGRFTVREQALIGLPEGPPPLAAELTVVVAGHRMVLPRAVGYKWTDPVAGERRRPLEVLPPVTLSARAPLVMFPAPRRKTVHVAVRASTGPAAGVVRPEAPAGFTVTPAERRFSLAARDEVAELAFEVAPPPLGPGGEPVSATLGLVAVLDGGGAPATRAVERIDYPHIPPQTLAPPAQVKLVRLEVARRKTRVGYIPGAGDEVAQALRQIGYDVTVLSDEALASEPLGRYEAIVTGVRAFNTNPRLQQHHARLMDFVKAGGTLVVQYNAQNRLSRLAGPIGPYPLTLSQQRVTEEDAAVEPLLPEHPVLRAPNRIGPRDFAGWVQERGLYFADTWDPKYEAVLAMHDAGEPPRKGGLLVARHGKGAFVYTGLALFRQLPAGVPGAYRLLSNLVSHGR